MDPRTAARTSGVDRCEAGRHHCRPGRPGHPRRVGPHGLPRRPRLDDPAERVAFILHDVFRYSFAEVAEIVGRTPAACRQLASSARRRLHTSQTPAAPAAQRAALVRHFKQAWEAKDIDALVGLLASDATAIGDGGGLVSAAPRPVEGDEHIARYLVDLAGKVPDLTIQERTVNAQPGLIAQQAEVTVAVFAFDVDGDRITRIWAVRNPEKLRPWTARTA